MTTPTDTSDATSRISPACAEGHNGEMGSCRGCGCGCHRGKKPIPGYVVQAAREAAARARQARAAQIAARDANSDLPCRLRDALAGHAPEARS